VTATRPRRITPSTTIERTPLRGYPLLYAVILVLRGYPLRGFPRSDNKLGVARVLQHMLLPHTNIERTPAQTKKVYATRAGYLASV
jgi:hypothetical protein